MDPLIRHARSIIDNGRLGRLLQIDGFYSLGLQAGDTLPGWASSLPGGMLEDLLPHLLTTARALAGARLVPEYWHVAASGQISGEDQLRLLLSGETGLSVSLGLSLTARPKAFKLVVRGTRTTLAIDLRNMLLHLSRLHARGGIQIGAELIRSSLGTLWQTVRNASGLVAGHCEPPGSFLHLIQAHYAALNAGVELPTPLRRSTETIAIIRHIWPLLESSQPHK